MEEFVRKYVADIVKSSIQQVIDVNGKKNRSTEDGEDCHRNIQRTNGNSDKDKLETFAQGLAQNCISTGLNEVGRKKVLCVGIVCLDLITVCEQYPDEDTETLAQDHYWSRGGNAANTVTVLAHLGARVEFLGTFVKNQWLDFILSDFKQNQVSVDHCVYLEPGRHKAPVATLILSKLGGTRTALPDFRGVTELSFSQFDKLDLNTYSWIHFEGRPKNPDIVKMMDKIEHYNGTNKGLGKITISVEIEQPHSICPELEGLFPHADVILMSKIYALDAGYNAKEEAVECLYGRCKPGASLICAWGDEGAAAISPEGVVVAHAFPPETIEDTLGAGDTFNASVIFALSKGMSLKDSVSFACYVAGAKCGAKGFDVAKGMQQMLNKIV